MTRTVVLGEPPAPLATWLAGRYRVPDRAFFPNREPTFEPRATIVVEIVSSSIRTDSLCSGTHVAPTASSPSESWN